MKPFRSNYIKVLLLPISQEIEYGEPSNINFLKKKKKDLSLFSVLRTRGTCESAKVI